MHTAEIFAGLVTDESVPVASDEETEMSLDSVVTQIWCLCPLHVQAQPSKKRKPAHKLPTQTGNKCELAVKKLKEQAESHSIPTFYIDFFIVLIIVLELLKSFQNLQRK